MFNYAQLDTTGRTGYGLIWGIAFLVTSLMLAGAGHGFFGTLGMFSAPFTFAGTQWAWYGCLPMALSLAVLAPFKAFPLFAAFHYVSVAMVVFLRDLEEWKR